jgi:hypothetical protein
MKDKLYWLLVGIGITMFMLFVFLMGVNLGANAIPEDTSMYTQIQHHLDVMTTDDRNNPVCDFYTDSQGYSHGCLTDVQLEAMRQIHLIVLPKLTK